MLTGAQERITLLMKIAYTEISKFSFCRALSTLRSICLVRTRLSATFKFSSNIKQGISSVNSSINSPKDKQEDSSEIRACQAATLMGTIKPSTLRNYKTITQFDLEE